MSKIVTVTDGNYKIAVSNGASGTITLDTTTGASGIQGTTIINGNLEVKGTTTTVESTVTTIADNIIELNSGEAGAGISASNNYIAGIEIDRGSLPAARIVFNEQTQFATGGTSGTGSFRLQDVNGSIMPLATNSINAESTMYITTPASHIDVSGTVNYERNIFEYAFNVPQNKFIITDPGSGVVKQADGLVTVQALVDYTTYASTATLQPGIADNDTRVDAQDLDTTTLESRIKFTVDNTVVGDIYSNRIEVLDIKLQDNEISSLSSNTDLKLSASGLGSVVVKDGLILSATPWDDDVASIPPAPTSGIKFYARNTANTPGNTGLFYVNSNSERDELVSKNRALLYGMLF